MCLGDWRLGRLIRAVPRNLVIAPATIGFIERNPQRVGITFSSFPNALNLMTIAFMDGSTVLGQIGNLEGIQLVQHLTIVEYGDLVQMRLRGSCNAGFNIDIVEYIVPESALSMLPEALGAKR